ncbi:hypothetical protein L2E82_36464 [Cichorium intybus]|uniref:Uncharacterized protein n=1 Tax=Cichorium intybus TaxID=13427 RepID=A0ACB9BRR5_CICIN|nr:hypothetical protein L2E82_36464 [Cichorium intybus]
MVAPNPIKHNLLLQPPQNDLVVRTRRFSRRPSHLHPDCVSTHSRFQPRHRHPLIFTALYNIVTGLLFGIHMLVQLMKSIVVVAIFEASLLTLSQIAAADIVPPPFSSSSTPQVSCPFFIDSSLLR